MRHRIHNPPGSKRAYIQILDQNLNPIPDLRTSPSGPPLELRPTDFAIEFRGSLERAARKSPMNP